MLKMQFFVCGLCLVFALNCLGEAGLSLLCAEHANPRKAENDSLLTQLKRYQCRSIPSITVAKNILSKQESFAEKTFEALSCLNRNNGYENESLQLAIKRFREYYCQAIHEKSLEAPQFFQNEQRKMYQIIHETAGLSEPEKMALEYGIGLIRVLKAYELNLAFAEYLMSDDKFTRFKKFNISEIKQNIANEDSFFGRVAVASSEIFPVIDEISRVFLNKDDSAPSYWQTVSDFYVENPLYEQLAKSLVSIQYVPDEMAFLGIAQFIHWNGVGGNGTYPLQEELEALKAHSFNYHGKEQGIQASYEHFSQRMRLFGKAHADLKMHINTVLFNALNDKDMGSPIYMYDACSGPRYSAIADVTARLAEKGRKVCLTLSDVDGNNLKTLVEEKHNDLEKRIVDVRYEDLNLPLDISESEQNHYDLVSASIGLHQLSEENQRKSIQYFTKLARVGGFISIPHVNELVHTQLMLIPVNILDREGYVSDDLLLFKFTQLAVPTDKKGIVKVPYPISKANIPQIGSDPKPNFYDYTLYLVVELPAAELETLQMHFNRGEYTESNQLIKQLTGFDIEQLEEKLLP